MDTNLIYMPVFRVRQQEVLAMKHFDFGDSIYPLLEIVKEKTRKNDQNTFEEIYSGLILLFQFQYFLDLFCSISGL